MFESILGLVMIYSFIHGSIIVGKKITGTTKYENVVLIVAVVSMSLLLLGVMFG